MCPAYVLGCRPSFALLRDSGIAPFAWGGSKHRHSTPRAEVLVFVAQCAYPRLLAMNATCHTQSEMHLLLRPGDVPTSVTVVRIANTSFNILTQILATP